MFDLNQVLTFVMASGLIGGVAGGVATVASQKWIERRQSIDQARFQIYMMLLDLDARHFWIVSAEARGEESLADARDKFNQSRWRISDQLRKADKLPECEDILHAMFSVTFKSEIERSEDLGRIIDQMGQKVNPRFARAMRQIGKENEGMMNTNLDEYFRRRKKIEGIVDYA